MLLALRQNCFQARFWYQMKGNCPQNHPKAKSHFWPGTPVTTRPCLIINNAAIRLVFQYWVTYAYTCLPVISHVYSCLPMFTTVYQRLISYVYPSLLVLTYVYHCLLVLVYQWLPMFTRVYLCLLVFTMFTCVYLWLPLFTRACQCLQLLNNVYHCLLVSTHV